MLSRRTSEKDIKTMSDIRSHDTPQTGRPGAAARDANSVQPHDDEPRIYQCLNAHHEAGGFDADDVMSIKAWHVLFTASEACDAFGLDLGALTTAGSIGQAERAVAAVARPASQPLSDEASLLRLRASVAAHQAAGHFPPDESIAIQVWRMLRTVTEACRLLQIRRCVLLAHVYEAWPDVHGRLPNIGTPPRD